MYKDKVDERIIGYLKEDSRESFVDIGKKLKPVSYTHLTLPTTPYV